MVKQITKNIRELQKYYIFYRNIFWTVPISHVHSPFVCYISNLFHFG